MTTQLVRDTMKLVASGGMDPTEMHWFDATGCFSDQSELMQSPLLESRPPFQKCMVCWEGNSANFKSMKLWVLVAGNDPEEGIVLTAWRKPKENWVAASPNMVYCVEDGQVRYGPVDENTTMDKTEAEMLLGFVSAWYESLSRRSEAYMPVVAPTFTNRRKIAQGKMPTYDWRTVVIEPVKPRSEDKGGTHASPRLHDRRGHLRRLRSGKNVWVKACKVGDPTKGAVFHDYKIAEAQT